jgi:hypothetical protein
MAPHELGGFVHRSVSNPSGHPELDQKRFSDAAYAGGLTVAPVAQGRFFEAA